MEKSKYLIFVLFLSGIHFFGISQNYLSSEWLLNSSGSNWSTASDEAIDCKGNVYITGNFTNSMQVGSNSVKIYGDNGLFVTQVGANSNIKWLKKISGEGYCHASSIIVDSLGSLFICGIFKGEIGEGTSYLNSGKNKNAFIFKFDTFGNIKWGIQIDGSFSANQTKIAIDQENNLYFSGSFMGTLKLGDQEVISENFLDIFIAHYNYEGKLMKWLAIAGKGNDHLRNIVIDNEKYIYLTGSFQKDLTLGNRTLVSKGGTDVFLLKLDNDLQQHDFRQFGGYYDDEGCCLVVDHENNLLLSGTFTNEISLENYLTFKSKGRSDVFINKFSPNGQLIWADCLGSNASDLVRSITVNNLGNIYLCGNYKGFIEKHDQTVKSTESSGDNFLAKFQNDGQFRFVESIGNSLPDYGKGLKAGNDNYIYFSGNFSNKLQIQNLETVDSCNNAFFVTKLFDCDAALKVNLHSDTSICGYTFELGVEDEFETYFWNELPGKNKIVIDSTGYYILTTIDQYNCPSKDTVFVQLNKPTEFNLGGLYTLYKGENVTLYGPEDMNEYLWSNGSNSVKMFIDSNCLITGINEISLQVIDANKCISKEFSIIKYLDTLTLNNNSMILSENIKDCIKVFPNPTENFIYINFIKLNSEKFVIIKLLSAEGYVLFENSFELNENDNTSIKLNLENYPPGLYSINICLRESFSTYKIIKL